MDDLPKPHLRLVSPNDEPTDTEAYAPLPQYNWDARPLSLPLTEDEAATALHLAAGDIDAAASLLRAAPTRLSRLVKAHPRLRRIQAEHLDLALHRAAQEPINALASPDPRRREWGSSTILRSKLAQNHPLSPASTSPAATLASGHGGKIVISWETDPAPSEIIEGVAIDDDGRA